MDGGAVEGAGLGKQRVDAPRLEPLEVIAALRGGGQHVDQRGAGAGGFAGRQEPVDDAIAVDFEGVDDRVDRAAGCVEAAHGGSDRTRGRHCRGGYAGMSGVTQYSGRRVKGSEWRPRCNATTSDRGTSCSSTVSWWASPTTTNAGTP